MSSRYPDVIPVTARELRMHRHLVRAASRRAAWLGGAGGLVGGSLGLSDTPALAETTPLPMFANQEKLPKLPLPSLDETLERYLSAVEPVVSAEQFRTTRALVDEQRAPGSELRTTRTRPAPAAPPS